MLGTEALLSRRVPEQISMVQGLRHHAAGARYVRRSERQVLARAVGVCTVNPLLRIVVCPLSSRFE